MRAISVHGISGCQQCGRVFGKEMLACPERRGGNCPFTRRNRNLSPMHFLYRLTGAAIFFLPLLFLISMAGLVALTGVGELNDLICIPVALLVMSVGLAMIMYSNVELWDAKNKILSARKALRGIELEQSVTVTIPDCDSRPPAPAPTHLSHPGSHVEYYRYYKEKESASQKTGTGFKVRARPAVLLFEAAFADLLSKEFIRLQPCTQYWSSNRKQGEEKRAICLFVPDSRLTGEIRSGELGWLETSILEVIKSLESEPCPDGLPVYHLVRAVLGGDKENPGSWPISMVEQDMTRAGKIAWCAAKRWTFFNRLILRPEAACQLAEEQTKLLMLKDWMHDFPALTDPPLQEEIESAINSRQAKGDNSWW